MGDNQDLPEIPLRDKVERLEEEIAQIRQQQPRLFPGPTIGEVNDPHSFYRSGSPIILPQITNPDFELKSHLISQAEAKPFEGLSADNPLLHLKRLEKLSGIIRINGVGEDYILCKLFEFSLTGRAEKWFASLPPRSLDGWEQVQKVFLNHFFSRSKTAELKKKILSFKQLSGETFSEAWERFQTLGRDCPHHGFSSLQMLAIFYEGVYGEYKVALDAASGGNFMTRTEVEGMLLINNLAESLVDSDQDGQAQHSVYFVESQTISEQLDSIERMLYCNGDEHPELSASRDQFGCTSEIMEDTALNEEQDACYASVMHSQDAFEEMKAMMGTIIENQKINDGKTEERFNALDKRFDDLQAHVLRLDKQVAQNTEALRKRNNDVSAIALRSGRQVISKEKEPAIPPQVDISNLPRDVPDENDSADTGNEDAGATKRSSQDIPPASGDEMNSRSKESEQPKVPYPVNARRTKRALEEAKCKELIKDIEIRCKLQTAVHLWPAMKATMKNMITSKITEEEECILISEECSAVLTSNLPAKRDDPGKFVLQ